MYVLVKNTTITDCNREHRGDVLIEDGLIRAVGDQLEAPEFCTLIDGEGHTLMPAFVDLHAHFRDPGLTHKEDVRSGCRAAVHGGYTTVHLMPNTKPIVSTMSMVEFVQDKAKELGLCDVYQSVCITEDFDGKSLSHLERLDGSVRWITDDGFGIDRAGTMMAALEIAKRKGMGLMLHEEDSALSDVSKYLSEEIPTYRDVQLARHTGCRVHFCHVSTINSINAIIEGKKAGALITCEVTPHHLALNSTVDDKVNPPLRGEVHRQYLIECLKYGHIDAIATDHAPHTMQEKANGASGFTGLDLAFATCYTTLVAGGHLSLQRLSCLLSESPARILGVSNKGKIQAGMQADLVLVDTEKSFTVTEAHIHSKSKNTPMLGKTLQGEIIWTMKGGELVYEKDN